MCFFLLFFFFGGGGGRLVLLGYILYVHYTHKYDTAQYNLFYVHFDGDVFYHAGIVAQRFSAKVKALDTILVWLLS